MRTLQNHWSYLAVALAATAFACVKGEQSAQQADSTARNLTLAPTESSAAMKDVPAAQPAQPEKKATTPAHKAPAPKPAAPTTLTLGAGTRVGLAASDSISTRSAKAGDAFTATVGQDVKDASGHVVIPAGSKVEGTITAADPGPNPNQAGKAADGKAGLTDVSVSCCAAAAPGIGHPDPAGGGSHDGVHVRLEAPGTHLVAHRLERIEGRRHEARPLHVDQIGQRLVMQARGRHRIGERHLLIDHVADHLIHGRGDAGAAGGAEHEQQAPSRIEHD